MKTLLARLKIKGGSVQIWIAAVLIAGALAFYWDQTAPRPPTSPHQREDVDAADTFIPEGYVLVPIEVANFESLDSILGKFGVVDLFVPSNTPTERPIKVASQIKILRAPLNPNHFAVLAPEDDAPRLVRHEGAFTVIIRNPKRPGTEFVKRDVEKSRARRTRITVEVPDAD